MNSGNPAGGQDQDRPRSPRLTLPFRPRDFVGIVFADAITTVSPTYAREILTPRFGMGMEGVLALRRDDGALLFRGQPIGVVRAGTL